MALKWSRFNVVVPIPEYKAVVIFNTLSRNIVSVDRGLIEPLQHNDLSQLSEEELQKLKYAEVLVDDQIDEVAYMRYLLGIDKYTHASLGLFISFTAECNLRCVYCYEDYKETFQGKDRKLTWNRFEPLLRFINYQKERGLRHIDVVFFGGEPLMNYEVVYKAAKVLKAYEKDSISVAINLITNGTLLTPERCCELAPYITLVQTTLDGPKHVHDQRRPYKDGRGSYDDIVGNLKNAVNYFKDILVQPVVDEHNASSISELLRELKEQGLHDKLTVGFSPTCPSQSEVALGRCDVKPNIEVFETITQLYALAARLGYRVSKAFIKGPCLRNCVNRFAVDEHLNVYKCPADFYSPHPDAVIDEFGRLQILRSNWYESVTFEPACVATCVYAPICYGGCKWLAGGPTKTYCNKELLDLFITEMIRAYVISHYGEKLQSHQEQI